MAISPEAGNFGTGSVTIKKGETKELPSELHGMGSNYIWPRVSVDFGVTEEGKITFTDNGNINENGIYSGTYAGISAIEIIDPLSKTASGPLLFNLQNEDSTKFIDERTWESGLAGPLPGLPSLGSEYEEKMEFLQNKKIITDAATGLVFEELTGTHSNYYYYGTPEYAVSGYTGPSGVDLTIPAFYNGKRVTRLKQGAFRTNFPKILRIEGEVEYDYTWMLTNSIIGEIHAVNFSSDLLSSYFPGLISDSPRVFISNPATNLTSGNYCFVGYDGTTNSTIKVQFPNGVMDFTQYYGVCCLEGNTMISLSSGEYIKAKDIEVGDSILSLDIENLRNEFAIVNNVKKLMREAIFTIQTKSGKSILITDDHPIYTKKGWGVINMEKSQIAYSGVASFEIAVGDEILTSEFQIFDEIISITEDKTPTEVYAISVSKNFNFYANGLLVHNAGCPI